MGVKNYSFSFSLCHNLRLSLIITERKFCMISESWAILGAGINLMGGACISLGYLEG